ncbi:terpene cyclase/mutase family protein [Myxococcota bacterium]|nr:terpene cyclase/mutase family protein [Myxococcota bacterium]
MKLRNALTLAVALAAAAPFDAAFAAGKADAAPAAAPPAAAKAGGLLDAKTVADARSAVDRGLHFLRSKQAENGSYGNHVGLTSMALLAFAGSHRAYRDADGPFVRRATEWLLAQQRADGAITGDATPAYNTALAIMALHDLDPAKYKTQIEAGQKFLANDQSDEDKKYTPADKYYGGIGYGGDERPDLSNLGFALEALKKTGYDPKSDVWKKAETFLTRCQNRSESNDQPWSGNDGGFVYEPGDSKAGGTKSYGGMTFAGLKSLIFANVKKDDPRVKAAWGWIQKNYDFTQHPGLGTTTYYYYLHTAASALEAMGEPYIPDEKGQKRNWAQDMTGRIVSLQKADGSWLNENGKYWEDNPVLVTSRAVVALSHALRATGNNAK